MRCLSIFSRCLPVLLLLLAGCASPRNNYDPLESINRPIYRFNKAVDDAVLRPVAKAWSDYLPSPVKKGVHNFFENIGDLFAIPPALLQGKGADASHSAARVIVNTTAGLGGLIDWASDIELKKSNEDFGQMLGFWGVPSGPYLMLPFLGPVTARDTIDPALRFTYGPTTYIDPESARYVYIGVGVVDGRAQFLSLDKMLAEQYDQYAFLRDTYLQNRWFKVHDGNPPHPLKMAIDEEDEADSPPISTEASKQTVAPASSPVSEVATP